MGGRPGRRHDRRPAIPRLQREARAAGQDRSADGRHDVGRRAGRATSRAGPRRQQDDAASPATPRGTRAASAATCRRRPTRRAAAAQRGRRDPQLHALQLPDAARRRLHAGHATATSTGNRIVPARSTCAVHVGSHNGNRESIYSSSRRSRPRASAGTSFSTNVPHTVRGEARPSSAPTATCRKANDNNALMAQLLMQGTNYLQLHRPLRLGGARASTGSRRSSVTERDEPQAVIGSTCTSSPIPNDYAKHRAADELLQDGPRTAAATCRTVIGKDEVLVHPAPRRVPLRRLRRGRLARLRHRAIDHKGFSERITTAPVSPLGQRFYVQTQVRHRASPAPTTLAVDPTRTQRPENQEQTIHPLYAYLYVTDREEGLVVIGNPLDSKPGVHAATATPSNNFLKRAADVQPRRRCSPAPATITIVGHYAYVLRTRAGRRRPRRPAAAADRGQPSASRTSSSRARSPSSSATPS